MAANAWYAMESGTSAQLRGVWGTSSSNVFAVGNNGTILHYSGNAWNTMPSGTTVTLREIWGSSPSDVFAVGDNGTILHYDGNAWNTMPSGTTAGIEGIWGSSSSDVFAVGDNGTILRYDGNSWSTMPYGDMADLYDVWGTSSSDVYAAAVVSFAQHYDGDSWLRMNTSHQGATIARCIWVRTPSDLYYGGDFGCTHYDGNSWGLLNDLGTSTTQYYALSGSPSSVLAAARGPWGAGILWLQPSGSSVFYTTSSEPFGTPVPYGLWRGPSGEIFAVGSAGHIWYYGPEPPPTPTPTPTPAPAPRPDLVVASMSAEWVEEGATYNVTFSICNSGASDAGDSMVSVYIDSSLKHSSLVASLGVGECSDSMTFGPYSLSGDLDIIEVRADAQGWVAESDEGNNLERRSMPPSAINCFIATSACGPDDANVDALRAYRDTHLKTDSLGSGFVSAYYKVSPPIAAFIDDHPALKPVVRAALLPAVGVSEAACMGLAGKSGIVSALLLVSAVAVVWLMRWPAARRY
jgi:uncharacterized membrane protein